MSIRSVNVFIEPCNVSWGGTDLGLIDGELEIKFDEKAFDLTAHQEGANILGRMRIGKHVSLTTALKESSLAQLKAWINAGGVASTPAAEVTSITCIADVAGNLNNKYFTVYSATDAVKYHVWLNVNSAGVDPAPSGSTAIAVALATGATATQVATAVAAAMDALAGFVTSSLGAIVTNTNAATGSTTDASDSGTTGFTISVTTQGIGTLNGWGNSKDGTDVVSQAAKLVLHPVASAATDLTKDFAAWLAYPDLKSIKKSGEKEQMVHVDWHIFPDATRQAAVRLFVFGDHR